MDDYKTGNGEDYSRFYQVIEKAQEMLTDVSEAVRTGRGCNEIFTGFAGVRDVINDMEGELLALQLERCLMPQIGKNQEIINAATVLATKRHGALIAIERNQVLAGPEGVSIGGTAVDAKLSAMLLESIFYPGNPLHDGGVIVNQDKIIAAGCIFPLSEKHWTEDRKTLGTRHRAALGLSEVTDALVLVVSEETGRISLAAEGQLYMVSSACDLHHRIFDLSRVDTANHSSPCYPT